MPKELLSLSVGTKSRIEKDNLKLVRRHLVVDSGLVQ